jgi:hypothetical protein
MRPTIIKQEDKTKLSTLLLHNPEINSSILGLMPAIPADVSLVFTQFLLAFDVIVL